MTDASPNPDAFAHAKEPPGGLIRALEAVSAEAPEEGVTLGRFTEALGERAFGVLLFALAIPVCIPFLYGVPQVVALPMMAIALQMAAGRPEPWMPKRFAARRMEKQGLVKTARGARKWFGWLEALARPRLGWLAGPRAERIVGGAFVLFCASVLVPLPATNTTPGVAIAVASLGLIARDGVLVLLGVVLGIAWIALLVIGFAVLGPSFLSIAKEAVLGLFGAGTPS